MQAIIYRLKYCEGCGSLRLRPADSAETYCQRCEQVLFAVPLPNEALRSKLLLRKPRLPKQGQPVLQAKAVARNLPCGRLQ
jgi:hypothetical protein